MTAWTTANGLTLHPDKTRMGDARQPGQIEFLGYKHRGGRRYVRKKSLKAFRQGARQRTQVRGDTSGSGDKPDQPDAWLVSPTFRADPDHVAKPQRFIRRRLRSLLRKQEKRPGFRGMHSSPRQSARRTPSSQIEVVHPLKTAFDDREAPDEVTNDCSRYRGRTARTVRREGRPKAFPTPLVFVGRAAWLTATRGLAKSSLTCRSTTCSDRQFNFRRIDRDQCRTLKINMSYVVRSTL